ncbi:MAG: ribonuclease R [Clostridia bacterium]|nr:ribonuclease R [Clostridia bacterium]
MTNLQTKIIETLKQKKIDYKNYNQLFLVLSKLFNENIDTIAKCVNKMIANGDLIEGKRELEIRKDSILKKGIIVGNRRGFGFVKPYTEFGKTSKSQIDLFIAPNKLLGALDGDEVLYSEQADKSAAVVKILKRSNRYLIGRIVDKASLKFKRNMEGEGFYAIPDNDRFSKPIFISKKELNSAKLEDRVEIELTFQPEGARSGFPVGKVKRILPKDDDIENGIISILCEHQIPDDFPAHVLKEADELITNFENEKKRRVDLTKELIVTIDGEDAKDFDDAISIEKTENGYTLGVHIADVGSYVLYESEIDKEAFIRGTSVYFPDRVYPMLPERLSNFLCSLRPNEEKLALSVEINLDDLGVVKSYKIFESVIKSYARLTYNQSFDVIKRAKGEKSDYSNPLFPEIEDEKIKEKILLMNELSKKIGVIRNKEGMLDFNIPETYFDIKDKEILSVKKRERNDSHKLIENFMILCNQVVAKHFALLEAPFVYRVHEAPAKARINEVIEVLNGFGLNVKSANKITPLYIQDVLEKLKGKPMEEVGNKIILRSLEKALYLEDCLGHFGLALQYYCHFTSPIRRYPDLTIHRIIKKACQVSPNGIITNEQVNNNAIKKLFAKNYDLEEFVADASLQSSDRELKSDESERDADDLFKAKYMEDKIGQEFEGKISSVSTFGFFVELPDTIEGLVKLENLPDDDYKYDEKKLVLKGRTHKYTIDDKVKVKLLNVNLTTRRIEFGVI